jgi:hypothetical protein
VAEAVRTIGGDLEIDDAFRDLRDLEPAQRDLAGDDIDVRRDPDELSQPFVDDLHSGNCSRKRRSFS